MKNDLPKSWILSTIEDSIEILDNQRKPVNAIERAKRVGNIPYYGATGLAGYIDDFLFDDELVLLGEDGAPFFDKSKDVAFIINGKTWVNNHAHVLRAQNITTNSFLLYYLNQFNYNGFVGGTTRLKLTQTDLKKIPFPIPPLPEQNRIVAKLDSLFSSIDTINDKIQKIVNLNEKYFESVFYNNSGLESLEKFLIESKDRVGKDWDKYRKIGVSAKKGIIDLDIGTKTSFENYKVVQSGDFIYNTMRVNIGSIAIYEDEAPAITSPDYVVFRVENISKFLLLNYLKSEIGRKNISSLTIGSVRSRLYFKSLIQLTFPAISNDKHDSAESILKWFNSNIRKLRFMQDVTLNNLKKTILDKAFKGELVPQLPTDGDAKDLLKEILKLKSEVKKK